MRPGRYSFGPLFDDEKITMGVYAPERSRIEISLRNERMDLEKLQTGFWQIDLDRNAETEEYSFYVDGGGPFPDPASRFMPNGITGASQIIDTGKYEWDVNDWKGIPLNDYIIEEIHTGTYTEKASYRGIEEKLDYLQNLGITAIEIMPVAQFFGTRNWGYDGVYVYSPQHSYGRPEDLMHLVDTIHAHGLCAILDVVYNHSGSVGNYLDRFAPFHSSDHNNTWGICFNFDGEHSEEIREFVLQNVTYWLRDFKFDALRLDAVQGIVDNSPVHILEEMSKRVAALSKETGRNIYLIAESDSNDCALTTQSKNGGMGINAQWNDDFHHSLHAYLTGENQGYYSDYGGVDDIFKVIKNGFLYQGEYSRYLERNRGTRWTGPPEKLVVFGQNHDQIGNRALGERLITIAGERKARLAAAFTLLSPFTPLLFMGEEFGATSPFLFFIDSTDPAFAKRVYSGRMAEFKKFRWSKKTPDPNSLDTFNASKINWDYSKTEKSRQFERYYRDLISIRKKYVTGRSVNYSVESSPEGVIKIHYENGMTLLGSFSESDQIVRPDNQSWLTLLNSESVEYGGTLKQQNSEAEAITLKGYSTVVITRAL